jgi:hypothetical protein
MKMLEDCHSDVTEFSDTIRNYYNVKETKFNYQNSKTNDNYSAKTALKIA